jgi:hypothetical protein
MAEFIDCAAVVCLFYAFIALVVGLGSLALGLVTVSAATLGHALELAVMGAVALGLALARRWWDGRRF